MAHTHGANARALLSLGSHSSMSRVLAIANRTLRIVVVGVGQVGLTLTVALTNGGYRVVAVDTSAPRRAQIASGTAGIEGEPELAGGLRSALANGQLHLRELPTADSADVAFVCVDTPVFPDHTPNLEPLVSAALCATGALVRSGLLIIESTVPPGTMAKLARTLVDHNRSDIGLAYVPERVMPGKMLRNLRTMPRIIGAEDPAIESLLHQLYATLVDAPLHSSNWVTAELAKCGENALRDVNIAFANVLATLCEQNGAYYTDVAARIRDIEGRGLLRPGLVAGACLPKDTHLLAAATATAPALLVESRRTNDAVYSRIAQQVRERLDALQVELASARVAILGTSYLPNLGIAAGSPADLLESALRAQGLGTTRQDPQLPAVSRERAASDLSNALNGADAAIVVTQHEQYLELAPADAARRMRTPLLYWVEPPPVHWRNAPGVELIVLGEGRVGATPR
jgi:nucleotide sugar dehydrogenase